VSGLEVRRDTAVVLYTGDALSPTALREALEATPPAAGDVHVLHTGLDPHVVTTAARSRPGIRFVLANAGHYEQFAVDGAHRLRLLALDALRLTGYRRLLVVPADAAAVRLALPALAWRPGAAPPAPGWTADAGAGRNRILLVGGGLAGEATLRRVDRALATGPGPGRAPWRALARVRSELVAAGDVPDDATTVLLARPAAPPAGDDGARPDGDGPTAAELLESARAQIADGDFDAARETLLRAAVLPGGLSERHVLALARVLKARSEYAAARDVLQLLDGNPASATRGATEAAEIAWIQHDYAAGEALALYALRASPVNRRAEVVRDRCREPFTTRAALPVRDGSGPVLSHVAFYVGAGGNFGDIVLPDTVREAVASVVPAGGWLPVHAHQVLDAERLELVNGTDGVVVGGGGLFLPDTAPNATSGWQWNVPRESLERLSVPLAVVAVGFNLFEGQAFRGSLFRESLEALVERAALVGLRNRGSVARVRDLLPERLAGKVSFLPCPTTVLSHLHPRPADVPARGAAGAVLVNAAYDRSARRFGEAYEDFLGRLATYLTTLRSAGAEVRCAAHLPADERLAEDLASRHGIRLPVDALYDLPAEEGFELYRRAGVVVGMRGHATMIPFGLGTPVLSLVSHPKLRFFLEDVGRPEWGFDVTAPDLAGALAERTLDVLERPEHYRQDVAALQLELLAEIQGRLSGFAAGLSPSSLVVS
jgi:polysaccharide pyruvyl transferase WcaK-like protein